MERFRLDALTPKGMSGFCQSHTFAGARIEDPYGAGGGRAQGLQSTFEGDLIGGVIAVLGEVARQARKHQGHGRSSSVGKVREEGPQAARSGSGELTRTDALAKVVLQLVELESESPAGQVAQGAR